MKTIGNEQYVNDFLRGQRDALEGIPHTDQGEAYERGYSAQYAAQETIAWFYEYQNQPKRN